MKLTLIIAFFVTQITFAQDNLSALMPYPNSVEQQKGLFGVSPDEQISIRTSDLQFAAEQLQRIFETHFNRKPTISSSGRIKLKINTAINGDEAYRLNISPAQILIEGNTAAGVLYGCVTLNQLLTGDVVNTKLR